MTLRPPSSDSLARILTLRYARRNVDASSSIPSSLLLVTNALGANSRASPVRRPTIIANSSSCLVALAPSQGAFWLPEVGRITSGTAIWAWSARSHAGEVNRWTMVVEHRSRSSGAIVGSCVPTMIRAPRCRCSLTTDRSVSVNAWDSAEVFMY